MQNYDTTYLYNCRQHSGTIITPNTIPSYAEITVDSWVIIYSYGQPISIFYNTTYWNTTCNNDCWIKITSQDTTITYYTHETASISSASPITFLGDSLVIHFHREPFILNNISISWTTTPAFQCTNLLCSFTNIAATTADLQWQSPTCDTVIIDCGPSHLVTSDHNVHLTGLQPNTPYELLIRSVADSNHSCCATSIEFHTDVMSCIGDPDMQDLDSYYCQCHYGTFLNPYQTIGRIDYGPQRIDSRHTLHTDTTETDPRTGGMLHTVCPGTSQSVRLGNWNAGSQAESISYQLHVDTLIYSLLLLRYAVVLENPSHPLNIQPRFRLEILDTNLSVIDADCGMADFIANEALGWNSYNNILWKDWTTVGFDLTPYHDQTIILRFTTFDCNAGGHYGYAYYHAECIPRSVASESCGPVDSNSVTAPDGFLYSWYISSPDSVLSSQQSYTFLTQDAYVYCRLTSTENHQCHVTMSAYTGNRWPHAVADTIAATNTCQGYTVTFIDRSDIVNSLGQPCGEHGESRRWDFDDGDSSSLIAPQHTFTDTGWHQVILVSSIANDLCADTTVFNLFAPPRVFAKEPVTLEACDSLLLADGHWHSHDTTLLRRRNTGNCDSIDIYNLIIHPSFHADHSADTFCYTHTYTWRGQTVGQIDTDSTLVSPLADSLVTAYGCDSIYTITLVQMGRTPLSIDHKSDCIHKTYRLTAHSPLPYIHWNAEPDDGLLDGYRHDSIIYVMPHTTSRYILTTDYHPYPFCPTSDTVTLRPVTFPDARLFVQPEVINVDYPILIASDRSHESLSRSWQLLYYPDGIDTVFLSDTIGTLHLTLSDLTIDSMQVILSVSNDICYDTARRTIPVIGALLWAPNVFTPGEGTNNRFSIVGAGLLQAELSIYNREGLLIYRTTDLDAGWDGTREGRPCPQAAYVWHLRYRASTYPDSWQSATGTITLLR